MVLALVAVDPRLEHAVELLRRPVRVGRRQLHALEDRPEDELVRARPREPEVVTRRVVQDHEPVEARLLEVDDGLAGHAAAEREPVRDLAGDAAVERGERLSLGLRGGRDEKRETGEKGDDPPHARDNTPSQYFCQVSLAAAR